VENTNPSEYVVETLNNGSVCVRLSADPKMFAIGETIDDAMCSLTDKLLIGESLIETESHLSDMQLNILEAFVASTLMQKMAFTFRAYASGYTQIYAPFDSNLSFVVIHAIARLCFSQPVILVVGVVAIVLLAFGLFTWAVGLVSTFIASLL
jgi:hypothetical protein